MHIYGIVMTADLKVDPADPEKVEMLLAVQGVGRGQPRKIVVPMAILVAIPEIDPEVVKGHAFQAEVDEEAPGRWVASAIGFAENRVLRPEGS